MTGLNGQPTGAQAQIVKGKSPRNALISAGVVAAVVIAALGFYYQVKESAKADDEAKLAKKAKQAEVVDKSTSTQDVDKIIEDQQSAARRIAASEARAAALPRAASAAAPSLAPGLTVDNFVADQRTRELKTQADNDAIYASAIFRPGVKVKDSGSVQATLPPGILTPQQIAAQQASAQQAAAGSAGAQVAAALASAGIDAPDVAEIMINDFSNIWIERRGTMERLDLTLNEAVLDGAISALAASVDKSAVAGTAQGIINAGHKNLRIASVMRPTAIDGNALSIRKHRDKHLSLHDYVNMGAFSLVNARKEKELDLFPPDIQDDALREALSAMVRARRNVLVAGGTSSGKTTLLNALNAEIPEDERVITVEDTMELKLTAPNRVRLLSNPDKGVTTQLLVALCLRFRPDRIIVGEVRSGEAYDFIQALSTGHDGGMGSIHANDARGGLSRLESLAMLGVPPGSRWELADMRKAVADCFHYVIHLRRTGELRHVSEILEIKGFRDGDYVLNRVF